MNAISQSQMAQVQSALGGVLLASAPEALPHLVRALTLLSKFPHALPIVVRFLDLVAKGGGFLDAGVVQRAAIAASSEYTSEKLAREWLRLTVFRLPARRPKAISEAAWKRLRAIAADQTG